MTLIYLTLAWAGGILLARHADIDHQVVFGISWIAFAFAFYFWRDTLLRLFFLALLFGGLGMLRFEIAQPRSDHVARLNDLGGALTLRGVIVGEPQALDNGLRLQLDAQEAAGQPVKGRVLVNVPRYADLRYGDRVEVFGVLRTPPEFDTFAYRDHLARQGIFSVMYNADVTLTTREGGAAPLRLLYDTRAKVRRFITRSLPEPQASLLVGILLGDESGIPAETETAFTRTGASHIIAISGFNMVILAQVIMGILQIFLSRQKAALPGVVAIALYTLFVGAGAAVVRAAVMSSLLITGQALNRRAFVPASLAFAALLMSLLDPWVLWHVSFQLSFAAVMGMALFVPPLQKALGRVLARLLPEKTASRALNALSESLIVTLAAQITTTPLILLYFGRLSVVSLPVNFLIIPAQTPLLLTGAVGVLVGLIFPLGGELILQATWVFLTWSVKVVEYFGTLSWADTDLPFSAWGVALFFALLGGVMVYQATRPRWALRLLQNWRANWLVRAAQAASLILLVILIVSARQKPDGKLHLTFLDVGQANGVLIESPNGAVILVDGGRFPSRLLKQLGDSLPARTRHIDAVFITSPLSQNIAALPEVLDRYQVGAVLTNGETSAEPDFVALMERIESQQIPLVHAYAGYTLQTDDGLVIEVLHPAPLAPMPEEDEEEEKKEETEPINANMVLRVRYGTAVFLLTANSDAGVEEILLQHPHQIQTSVLQAANHGADNATSLDFLRVAAPQVAVIQLDISQAPSPTVVDRLDAGVLFRTDQHGRVEIVTDGTQLWVYPAR